MASHDFRLALNSKKFPFLSRNVERGVVRPQLDIPAQIDNSYIGDIDSKDNNTVELVFCENALATQKGYKSVKYESTYAPAVGPQDDFDKVILVPGIDGSGNFAFKRFVPGNGKNYVSTNAGAWVSYNAFDSAYADVTNASVGGRVLICYAGIKVVEYDDSVPNVLTRALILPAPLTIADIKGIAGVSNYLVAWTDEQVLWSSLTNILDFTDTVNGAGGQIPIDLLSPISAILPVSGGMIVYTTRNAISGTYTDNAASPFRFRGIGNSGGVTTSEQVAIGANFIGHYTYGTAGLQMVSLQGAEPIFPECSDFLKDGITELYDYTTQTIVRTEAFALAGRMAPRLRFIGGRYFAISVSKLMSGFYDAPDVFDYILLYDFALKRWSKLRITHTNFSLAPALYLAGSGLGSTLSSFEFMIATGEIFRGYEINYGGDSATLADSVVIFGRIQLTRGRKVTFQSLEVDGIKKTVGALPNTTPDPNVRIRASITGSHAAVASETLVTPTKIIGVDEHFLYQARVTCENFDVSIHGNFDLTSAMVKVTQHGTR